MKILDEKYALIEMKKRMHGSMQKKIKTPR